MEGAGEMLRSTVKKVMWMGRATVFLVGLSVILALVLGVASRALGANGENFIIGNGLSDTVKNIATLPTKLTRQGTGSGPALQVTQQSTNSGASGIGVTVPSGKAPIKVSSSAGKATNLNADKLDGREASSFANVAHAHAGEEITSGTVAEPRIDGALARDAEVMNTVKASDGPGSGLDADTVDGKHAADFGISTNDGWEPAHECDTPSTWNQCAPVTFTNLDPARAYIATVWSSFSAKAPGFSSREVSYCSGLTSDRFSPSCMGAHNKVRVHDYFTAASTSAVSFQFTGQTSMTFYTAINPSAEFEGTNIAGDYVITTVMLRNAASPEA
jgi:hypothetical protein